MASDIKNVLFIEKHFDKHAEFILAKIRESNISLNKKSNKNINELVYPIVNLIDFSLNGDSNKLVNKTIDEIHLMYNEWYALNKNKFTTYNYNEINDIILDYKINGVGYYWVDLNCYYSCEMLFRLNNCARVNSYQNILELREHTDSNYNFTKVAIAISNDGFINQIRGEDNLKADLKYRDFIYDLFLNYDKLMGFKFLFTKETDFTHMDLTKEQLDNLRKFRPKLFTIV